MSPDVVAKEADLNINSLIRMKADKSNESLNCYQGLGLQDTHQRLIAPEDMSRHCVIKDYTLGRSRTCDGDQRFSTKDFTEDHNKDMLITNEGPFVRLSARRRHSLQLPSFESLGISPIRLVCPGEKYGTTSSRRRDVFKAQVVPFACGNIPPLTPPPETALLSEPSHSNRTEHPRSNACSTSQAGRSSEKAVQSHDSPGDRAPGMVLPEDFDMAETSQHLQSPWVTKASHKIVTALSLAGSHDVLQVVSQTLPSQARDSRSRPTFEEILENLQTDLDYTPYITITHAVPQARIMEELPKTPPSTPNFRHEAADYFGNDQTIFTHAAVVPIYHTYDRIDATTAERIARHIAAPCSTQVSILERYIPPTLPQEIDDFFGLSAQSYLVDRLSELSTDNGCLLLLYPTLTGGKTFKRQYLDPILDPYLRQFVMLNNLTSDAAALIGEMAAVDHMLDFQEMERRVIRTCQALSERPPTRGQRSAFSLTHSETANITLDRSTWINWFIEQEQSRIRLNLVQYHQAGNRMPQSTNRREVTVGMLTRDFLDGLPKSRESSGNAGIEVGVFLITRSVL